MGSAWQQGEQRAETQESQHAAAIAAEGLKDVTDTERAVGHRSDTEASLVLVANAPPALVSMF